LRLGRDCALAERTDAMATLRIYALGRLRVSYDQALLDFPTKKAQDLLCFLLLHAGETLERELIAERLWPMRPPGKARRCLSTALWRLRQILERLESHAQPYLLTERSTLAFNTAAPYWFDVEVFEQKAAFGLTGSLPCTEAHRRALEEALDLYQGDLLEGCYDDWCLAERERLQLLLLRVLKRLQCHYRFCEAFEEAISCGHRLLTLDPLQEDVHRELMHCHVEAGQRPLALEQFRRCRETLRRELHIEPMPETWRLYRRIRGNQEPTLLREIPGDDRPSLQEALTRLRHTLDALESAWQALQAVTAELVEGGKSAQEETVCPEQR
jgi:DNA-binding SARP family transcriptional activator